MKIDRDHQYLLNECKTMWINEIKNGLLDVVLITSKPIEH